MSEDTTEVDAPLPHQNNRIMAIEAKDSEEEYPSPPTHRKAREIVYEYLQKRPVRRDPDFLGDDYRWGRYVGQGASGKVFQIEEVGTEIPLVIKVLKWRRSGKSSWRDTAEQASCMLADSQNLEDESIALSLNHHPHIIEFHDFIGVECECGAPFAGLITEAMDGDVWHLVRDLGDKGKTLDDGIVYMMFVQIIAALDSMHRSGWAHCDVKPDNIFYSTRAGKYTFKLGDFGLATHYLDDFESPAFKNIFSAPEAKDSRLRAIYGGVCAKSDIWSLMVSIMWILDAGKLRSGLKGESPEDWSWPILAHSHQKRLEEIAREDKRLSPLRCMLDADSVRRPDAATVRRKLRGRASFWSS